MTTIRAYREDDAAAVRACVVELQDVGRRIDDRLRPGESMADAYFDAMLERCRVHDGAILVADVGGVVAGFVMVLARVPFESLDDPPGTYALVAELVVHEDFRGRGLGEALLGEAERFARAAGATELRICVLAGNDVAARLYRRVGFAPYAETLAKRFDLPADRAERQE